MGQLVKFYKEFKQREEAVDIWRKGMYDKIRQEARLKLSGYREAYQVDKIEEWLRTVTYNSLYDVYGEITVVDYNINPQGVNVRFLAPDSPRTEHATFDWESIEKLEEKEREEQSELESKDS